MSSFDRRAFLAGAAVMTLGGCFRPMLAEDDAARAIRHRIALPSVDSRFDHYLVESLEDRLGTPGETDFVLEIVSEVSERGIAVTQDDAVTRITLQVEAAWSLRRPGGSETLIADVAFSQSGYNATASLFATRQTRLEIERRLARDIGERIARSILARADEFAA
jgi:LPS-assembly lipoprotein